MGRKPRTLLDLLHPDSSHKAVEKEAKQRQLKSHSTRKFTVNDKLFAKNFHGPSKWIPVTVVKVTGPVSYQVVTEDGITLRRHVDHLRYRHSQEPPQQASHDFNDSDDWPLPSEHDIQEPPQLPSPPASPVPEVPRPIPQADLPTHQGRSMAAPSRIPIRRSTRQRPPVDRYSPGPQVRRGGNVVT